MLTRKLPPAQLHTICMLAKQRPSATIIGAIRAASPALEESIDSDGANEQYVMRRQANLADADVKQRCDHTAARRKATELRHRVWCHLCDRVLYQYSRIPSRHTTQNTGNERRRKLLVFVMPSNASRATGIEAVITARRAALPTHEELQERLSALTSHLAPERREGTPGEVIAANDALQHVQSAGNMSLSSLELALARVEAGDPERVEAGDPEPEGPTMRQMADKVSTRLGLGPMPLIQLVEQAAPALGIVCDGGATLVERLKACHDCIVQPEPPADRASMPPSPRAGGRLLDGAYDEAASSESFAAALAAFRGDEEASRPKTPLGERLLAKGLVRGCVAPVALT